MLLYAFILLLSPFSTQGDDASSKGWILLSRSSSRAYLHINGPRTWIEAEDACQSHYGHLARDDPDGVLRDFIESSQISGQVWIGLHQPTPQEPFRWVDEFSWISEWAMNPHNKQASQPTNNQQSDNKFPTKNNDSKVSEKNKSSNTEEEKSSKISDLKTSTEGVTSPHDEETSHAVNQYGRPMCVALNIENQFRWDTRYCSGDSMPSAVCQIPVPSWIRTGECGLGRDWTLDSKLIYYPDNETLSCQCNGASQTICNLQGDLQMEDSCCFHKHAKESYVDEMFDNIFQIPKQAKEQTEQGSVLPSTKDDQSNDSVTIVDQITIKEGTEELRDDELYEHNRDESFTTTAPPVSTHKISTTTTQAQSVMVDPVIIASPEPVLEEESDQERDNPEENYINETDHDNEVKMTQAPTEEYKQVVAATENIQIMTTQEIINQSTQQQTQRPETETSSLKFVVNDVQTEKISSEINVTTKEQELIDSSSSSTQSKQIDETTSSESTIAKTESQTQSVPEGLSRLQTPIVLTLNRPRRDINSHSENGSL